MHFFQQTCIAFCTNNEVLIALPPAAVAVCALLNFFSTPSEVVETESFSNFSNFQSQSIGVLTSRDASDVLTKCQKCHILNDAIKIFCTKKSETFPCSSATSDGRTRESVRCLVDRTVWAPRLSEVMWQ